MTCNTNLLLNSVKFEFVKDIKIKKLTVFNVGRTNHLCSVDSAVWLVEFSLLEDCLPSPGPAVGGVLLCNCRSLVDAAAALHGYSYFDKIETVNNY